VPSRKGFCRFGNGCDSELYTVYGRNLFGQLVARERRIEGDRKRQNGHVPGLALKHASEARNALLARWTRYRLRPHNRGLALSIARLVYNQSQHCVAMLDSGFGMCTPHLPRGTRHAKSPLLCIPPTVRRVQSLSNRLAYHVLQHAT